MFYNLTQLFKCIILDRPPDHPPLVSSLRRPAVLRSDIQPVSDEHPLTALRDLLPDRMKPLQGMLMSGVDIEQGSSKTRVQLKESTVGEHTDVQACSGQGQAGLRLFVNYLLGESSDLSDMVVFSDVLDEQRDLDNQLFEFVGDAAAVSMVGTGDELVEQARDLLLDFGRLSERARFHREIIGDGTDPRPLRPGMEDLYYLRLLDAVRPFDDPHWDRNRALDRDSLLRRAHMFYTDEVFELSYNDEFGQGQPEAEPFLEPHLLSDVREVQEIPVAWTQIARTLVSKEVNIQPLLDRLKNWDPVLYERLQDTRTLNAGALSQERQIDSTQLKRLKRVWGLIDDEVELLTKVVNGEEEDEAVIRPLMAKIVDVIEERRNEAAESFFEDFPEPDKKTTFYRREGVPSHDIPIYNLAERSNARCFDGVFPIFRDMFAKAGIDTRTLKERLDDEDKEIWPQLEQAGALNSSLLANFDVVSRKELTSLEAEPWSLSSDDIQVIYLWLNCYNAGLDPHRLKRVLSDLYARYEEITGHTAVVVVDLHRDADMSDEDVDFLQSIVETPKSSTQPLLVTAMPFPGEGVGLDVLAARLTKIFQDKLDEIRLAVAEGRVAPFEMSVADMVEVHKWSAMVGRHADYRESLAVLKATADLVMQYKDTGVDQEHFLADAYFMAEDRKAGQMAELNAASLMLVSLLPGFIEQGRRAASDFDMEAANYSYQLVRFVVDYLLAALGERGLPNDDVVAEFLRSFNDDALLLFSDYFIGQSRTEGGEPLKSIYEAMRDYLKLVGAHMVARLPRSENVAPPEPPVVTVEISPPSASESLAIGGQTATDHHGSTLVGDIWTEKAPGIPASRLEKAISMFEGQGRLDQLSSISPLAETPAMLYALAEKFYCQGGVPNYEIVIDIAKKVHYGEGNVSYGRYFVDTVTTHNPRCLSGDILGVPSFCPVNRFGDRFYLEIVRLGLQASYWVLRQRFKEQQKALREGRDDGPEREAFAKAEADNKYVLHHYKLLSKELPAELSPFRQFNAESNQGNVALEIDRNFNLARHYFGKAAELVLEEDGTYVPGREMNARRALHLLAELSRQRVDEIFWARPWEERDVEDVSEKQIGEALHCLGHSLVMEDRLAQEETAAESRAEQIDFLELDEPKPQFSVQHKSEYEISFMQGLASLVALKSRFGAGVIHGHPQVRDKLGDDMEAFEEYYRDCEARLRGMHEALIGAVSGLMQITDQWIWTVHEIWAYMEDLAIGAPESILLVGIASDWANEYRRCQRILAEKPPLE